MTQLLSLEQKCIEMIKYGYVILKQFPRHEKHGLAAEIRESMWRTQRFIVAALKKHHKKTTLTELDIEIGLIKRQARISFSDVGQKLQSWIGHASHANSYGLRKSLLSRPFKRG